MAATKKAVYVRGPDDVFRRKDDDGPVTKKQVDTFINELMECGFRVAPENPEPEELKRKQDLSMLMNPKKPEQGHVNAEFPRKNSKLSPAPALRALSAINTDVLLATTLLPRLGSPVHSSHSFISANDTISETIHASQSTEKSASTDNSSATTFFDRPFAFKTQFEEFGTEKLKVWGPPFVLGMVTTYALQKMQPLLIYYGVIAAHLLKLFLVWLVFTGTVCWYFGALSLPAGTEYVQKIQDFMALLPIQIGQKTGETAPVPPAKADEVNSRRDSADSFKHLSKKIPAPPPKDLDENLILPTSTVNVVPFVAPKRQTVHRAYTDISPGSDHKEHRKHSEASHRLFGIRKHNKRPQSASPVSQQTASGRRHSSSSLPLENDTSKMRSDSHVLSQSQPDPRSELPFICEMKLRSKTESDVNRAHESSQRAGLKRSGTYMSQKSVLGTRANYSKFLANFDD